MICMSCMAAGHYDEIDTVESVLIESECLTREALDSVALRSELDAFLGDGKAQSR